MNQEENTHDFIEYYFGRYQDGIIDEDQFLDLFKKNLIIRKYI